jgi:hypothetical protein
MSWVSQNWRFGCRSLQINSREQSKMSKKIVWPGRGAGMRCWCCLIIESAHPFPPVEQHEGLLNDNLLYQ